MSKVDVKVVLLGKHSVGKTCLVERYLHGKFKDQTVATVGAAFGAKKVTMKGKEVTLGIWDTAGQERYESMSRIYYRSAKAAVICYDLTDAKSFEKARFWVEELQQNEEGCAIYVVGTKIDLIEENPSLRGTPVDVVKAFVKGVGGKSFEVSSKTGAFIEELFNEIADQFIAGSTTSPTTKAAAQEDTSKVTPGQDANKKEQKRCCG